jgi:ribosomal protein L11 methylase PrmA
MDEFGSLIPSSRGEKMKEPYFGTYHHSTSAASKKVRAVVKTMFTDAFSSLPFGRHTELRILDVGCGLGFLSCVSAEFYLNARITGIDTFGHDSLKRSSAQRAKENARIFGFSDRIDFKESDVFKFTPNEKFDIIISNLVFHNFGKMRFEAYSRLSSWAHAGSFAAIGDLFFRPKTDIAHITKSFKILRVIKPKRGFGKYALLVMSKDYS